MRTAHITSLLTGLALLVAAGCSNGSQDQTSSVRIRCFDGQAFCIISCDLGCTQTGCAVSEIAENQQLRFKFSDRVDPASVNFGSISIRTATGVAPNGDFVVNGSEVVFVPKVSSLGGVSSFGFQRNESYIITLAGGATATQGVRSLTGDRLSQEFSCTVVASRGVLDEDGLPPTVSLLSPTVATGAPRNPTIVLRFSELIDTTPLQSSLSAASPIRVTLRGLLPDGACNLDADGTSLEGVPSLSTERVNDRDVTVVAFTPSVQLPGQSCVTVFVTADLRDLSGRSATPAQFQFITEAGTPIDFTVREQFNSAANQDVLVSGGTWSAGARPGLVGGDGRHGSFRPDFPSATAPVPPVPNVFVWNVGNGSVGNPGFTIPASNTPSGQSFEVLDGRFFFTDFVLAEGCGSPAPRCRRSSSAVSVTSAAPSTSAVSTCPPRSGRPGLATASAFRPSTPGARSTPSSRARRAAAVAPAAAPAAAAATSARATASSRRPWAACWCSPTTGSGAPTCACAPATPTRSKRRTLAVPVPTWPRTTA
jgi:hypothetical protein